MNFVTGIVAILLAIAVITLDFKVKDNREMIDHQTQLIIELEKRSWRNDG